MGREVENDCDSLIELLRREDIPSRPDRPLLAIIGTIGVGKTTLARKVYQYTTRQKLCLRPGYGCMSPKTCGICQCG